jgi:hypothetical protein
MKWKKGRWKGKTVEVRKDKKKIVSRDAILTDSFNDVGQQNSVTHVSLQIVDQSFAACSA